MDNKLGDALALNRSFGVPTLAFDVRLSYLLDKEHCQQISKSVERYGGYWEIRKATSSLWKQLPSKSGIYMFVWVPDLAMRLAQESSRIDLKWILYVGRAGDVDSSNTIKERYRAEYSKYVGGDPSILWEESAPKTREERLKRYLTLSPMQYWYLEVEEKRHLPKIEKQLIKLFSPPLNRQGGPRIKTGKPIEAF